MTGFEFKDVFEFQNQYPSKEAREQKLQTMQYDEIMHLADTCQSLTAAIYYGKYAQQVKKGRGIG